MKLHPVFGGSLIGTAAIVVAAAQPVLAAPTQITGVKLTPNNTGVEVALETQSGDRPQVFTVSRGNTWVADMINTQLRIPEGTTFRRDNPAAGIAYVEIVPLDTNSVRVVVAGENGTPAGQITRRDPQGYTFNVAQAGGDTTTAQAPPAVEPAPGSMEVPVTPSPEAPGIPDPAAGLPTAPAASLPPNSVAPPFLPRAVAPPVGDIAVSNINVSPNAIDLGTAERVPRLLLRDAPARDVLSLLARVAGMNVAFADGGAPAADGAAPAAAAGDGGPTVSLDVENESVQDVFNYVLRLTGLEANRVGRTIFVGTSLPPGARGLVMRTLRLNQLKASMPESQTVSTLTSNTTIGGSQAGSSSTSQITRTVTQQRSVPVKGALQILEDYGANNAEGAAYSILRGLQVTADGRTNSITLLGPPDLIEVATAHLTQLDVRNRQVAVNVKIVEVDLLNDDNIGASFSFGIGDSFFGVDQGALTAGYGDFRPPSSAEARASLTGRPTIQNPFEDATTFIDPNSSITLNAGEGSEVISGGRITDRQSTPTTFFGRTAPRDDPFQGGLTDLELGTPNRTVIGPDGTPQFQPGTVPTAEGGLPSLFTYPRDFLIQLRAQVLSDNAKILTDPTLIVQEGSQAQVNLTQEVFTGNRREITFPDQGPPIETIVTEVGEAGVILNVAVDQIDDNGFITMSVAPEVSSPGASVSDSDGNLVRQLINRRRLETGNVRLRDGQTLILTGIIQEQDRSTVTKVPILGDLPIIGSLFRQRRSQKDRSEVVVLVTPQVIDDSSRATFGYTYTPGPEARDILRRGSR